MTTHDKADLKPARDQIIYANLLVIGVWLGIFILLITYFIYVTGILSPHVDLTFIPQVWDKGVDEYLKLTHTPHGWGWTALLSKGDFINYIGFSLLGLMTVVCYLVLLRGYFRDKNRIFATIAFLEIVVLLVAASGILGSSGH
jgi:hypothetical protein